MFWKYCGRKHVNISTSYKIHTYIFFNALFDFLDDNILPKSTQTLLCTKFPDYNSPILHRIAQLDSPICDLPDDLQQRYRLVVDLCRRLPTAFQSLSRSLAEHTLKLNEIDTQLQSCLVGFLQDIRKDMKPTDFRNLYLEEVRIYVGIFDCPAIATGEDTAHSIHLEAMLLAVKRRSEVNFTILITHFPRFLHMKCR